MPTSIGFDASNGVATLVLNRPDRLNALTSVMTAEILDALKTCARDDGIRCLVITGAGRGFCAGQDLEELQSVQGLSSVGDHLRHGFNQVVLGLRQLEKPVLGAINGVAAGAGLGIAFATDLRIASDKARLNTTFIGIGLVPDTGVSWFLHQLAGPARAFELLATGAAVDAVEAQRIGLVNQVVRAAEFENAVAALALRLAHGPTRGIGLTKRVLNKVADLDLAAALEYEAQVQDIAIRTTDHREGVAAFLAKRPPNFQGK